MDSKYGLEDLLGTKYDREGLRESVSIDMFSEAQYTMKYDLILSFFLLVAESQGDKRFCEWWTRNESKILVESVPTKKMMQVGGCILYPFSPPSSEQIE